MAEIYKTFMAEPLEDQRCPHGTRYPHPCRDCEDAWLKPGWSRAERAKPEAEAPQITREQGISAG